MSEITGNNGSSIPAEVAEELVKGARSLRRTFLDTRMRAVKKGVPIIKDGERGRALFLVRQGFAIRSSVLSNGRRMILDVLVPGDVAALDRVIVGGPIGEFTSASRLLYHELDGAAVRRLMDDRSVWLHFLTLFAEIRWRTDRLAMMVARLDAASRVAAFIVEIYQRLRRRRLISGMSFSLPLTQAEIADHLGLTLVHVNRTLRHLRETGLLIARREVIEIVDYDRLRALQHGLAEPAYLPSPIMPEDLRPT